MWKVIYSSKYSDWFAGLAGDEQAIIRAKIFLLEEYGPNLGRPHADTLKGSILSNLKELRARTNEHLFRIAYIFDEKRKCVLLTGGDKKGKNEKIFYKNLIHNAERIYSEYLKKNTEEI
ncbi:MAG: type II toxin-antitoxin system RelE/ParE family toxin [Spirochaetia bacterium]|jgi:hypothetical protein|nr:type II toxin-antitoxin system RelE/ParE family toxin [Spirochaetia bacterium]